MAKIKQAACIGGGVIGGAWAARFVLAGINTRVFDPHPDAQRLVNEVIANADSAYGMLTSAPLPSKGALSFSDKLEVAVKDADWIQESVPEKLELKCNVIAQIEASADARAIIGSSTSGLMPSDLQRDMKHPERMFVAHPYNPVYLLPLVELVGGQKTTRAVLEDARAKLLTIGMTGLIINKEIEAFVGDRLLEAFWREALWLIKDDVCDTETLDNIIRYSFGLRWAQMGLFETYRIAGGAAGMRDFLSKYGPSLSWPWSKLTDVVDLNRDLVEKIAVQSDDHSGQYSVRQLERIRDQNLVGILQALKVGDEGRGWGAGKLLADFETHLRKNAVKPQASPPREALRLLEVKVPAAWIDYNGHMTEYRYNQCFAEACDVFLQMIGADAEYVKAGHSYYTVETHVRLLAEAKLGEALYVDAQLMPSDGKKIHLFMSLRKSSDSGLVSTYENMMLHISSSEGRSVMPLPELMSKLKPLIDAHANLPVPDSAGRSVGVGKRSD
ncbi:L-carnitine dehydrogenase [Mesorhizobium amorphae]|uniref:carnitine 3-dehydrogenase n=1 Tax=Mesorhizobium amorphae TaxID=71433 RepID=UPI00235D646B|nr:carnitine 3-dehydrogenase [Mesorhizobium amorphae]GLR45320.1 L-carnitine dehydrogenase [Mesorhizobium amorphae]